MIIIFKFQTSLNWIEYDSPAPPRFALILHEFLKLFKINWSILEYLLNLLLRYLFAFFGECNLDVLCRNMATVVHIKICENGFKFLFCHQRLQIDGGSQELRVVDVVVSISVNIFNYFFNLSVRDGHLRFYKSWFEFWFFNETVFLSVKLSEYLLQIKDLMRVEMLDEDIYGSFFKPVLTFERSDFLEHFWVQIFFNRDIVSVPLTIFVFLNKGVL